MQYNINNLLNRPQSDIMSEQLVNNMRHELWKDSDYAVAYYLGVVNELKAIVKAFKKPCCMSRNDVLAMLIVVKQSDEVPEVIKDIIDLILKEFEEKEN